MKVAHTLPKCISVNGARNKVFGNASTSGEWYEVEGDNFLNQFVTGVN